MKNIPQKIRLLTERDLEIYEPSDIDFNDLDLSDIFWAEGHDDGKNSINYFSEEAVKKIVAALIKNQGSVLVDWEIEDLIDDGLADHKWKALINPASLDLTVQEDGLLLVPRWKRLWHRLTRKKVNYIVDKAGNRFERIQLSNYRFRPGHRVLLSVEQNLTLPPTITGQIYLKSSRGREFYEHLLAGWVDPGYTGNLTLELINHSYKTLPLAKGDRVVQIVFMRCNAPRVPYGQGTGKYQGDLSVSVSKDQ